MSLYNQTAWLRRVTGDHNSDGTPVYGPQTRIGIRFEEGTMQQVSGGLQTEFATYRTRRVYTDTELGFGDELTYSGQVYHVAGINTSPTLDGTIIMWEAVVQ